MKRVVVTGIGAISPLGHDWHTVGARLREGRNAVQQRPEWGVYEGLNTRLAVPAAPFELPPEYNRKSTRSMGRVALMATRASQLALQAAGLEGSELLRNGQMGISYGSSAGTPAALSDFGRMYERNSIEGINANTYIKMMPHTAAVNIGVFLGLTGRIITTSSACTSGSQGIGYAYEAIKYGRQLAMLAGGAEELDVSEVAVFDTLFATSVMNDSPQLTPRPFDRKRDGLVIGEGACTLVLEEYAHARARGAAIIAELVGFGTNSDGRHVTQPDSQTMSRSMQLALDDAAIAPSAIGYVNAHGTATTHGDVAESSATHAVLGARTPISSLKSYMGHTLGACGALEAWMTVEMLRDGWFAPTINLNEVDPACAELDYVMGTGRELQTEYVMTNNFAFGGINTSLVFRRI